MHDLIRWSDAHPSRAPRERAPLVWIGDAVRVSGARLAPDAQSFAACGRSHPLRLAGRLASNRSWFDARSAAFFAAHDALLRGRWDGGTFVARSLWPQPWRLGPGPPPPSSARAAAPAGVREMMRSGGDGFAAATLWQREPATAWTGKAVLAFVVNGAQGDDDEAHAGHFSIATGRIAGDGAIADWLVNSFYALDVVSEKGILAAPVPLERYQADVNSGQSWYRPTWALVAVLDDERAAVRVQSALNRTFRQFWRGQLPYYHPTDNCTSIAVDALRAIGLGVPLRGPTARLGAWLALPWLVLRERSLANAKLAYDYLVTERTRLLPAVALDAVLEALATLADGRRPPHGALDRELAADLAALAWLAIPQLPSSRAPGREPAFSLAEYRARVPSDPAQRQIIPLPPRVLPDALRDDDLLPPLPHPSDAAVRWWLVAPLALAALALAFGG